MSEPLFGLQLYTVREALEADFKGTMQRLYDLGIRNLEIYGGLPLPPKESAALFKDMGFSVISGHLPLPIGDEGPANIEAAKTFGMGSYFVPWISPETYADRESVEAFAMLLNDSCKVAADAGMEFGYHNHEFEFTNKIDGVPAYTILREATDPEVKFEVDTYWAQFGGVDPLELIHELGARASMIHIKDGPLDPNDRNAHMLPFGEGKMDIPAIVEAGKDVDAKAIYVELDHCATDMMEAVEKSWNYLKEQGIIS